jgi:hypothetical protein
LPTRDGHLQREARRLPIRVAPMQTLGLAISVCAFLLVGVVISRGVVCRTVRAFPLFYSYMVYVFCGSVCMYAVYGFDRRDYPSAYWFFYLVSILVEFSVLIEISDHIFRELPAIRKLGRALTVFISAGLGIFYILPAIIWSHGRRATLLDLTVRSSASKIVVLAVLFLAARHYGVQLGKNVGGLMLGFSIYLGISLSNFAADLTFNPAIYSGVLWIMTPIAYTLCLVVWVVSLWKPVPAINVRGEPESVALGLIRFNNELSKLLEK